MFDIDPVVLKCLSTRQSNNKVSKKLSFQGQQLLKPSPIDLAKEDSFLAIVTQKFHVSNDFESLKSFLKIHYCGDGHSSPGGERSIKSYYILSELLVNSESNGILEIEKRIMRDNFIAAKPDIWLVNGITKAIEIEPKVPQRQKVKQKVESLKSNGADKVLIAIAHNPEGRDRTIRQIRNRRLLDLCDGILLIDYTRFDELIHGEVNSKDLVKSFEEEYYLSYNQLACPILPRSRRQS